MRTHRLYGYAGQVHIDIMGQITQARDRIQEYRTMAAAYDEKRKGTLEAGKYLLPHNLVIR